MSSLKQVISGGQIGADIAGVRAAKLCGLDTGGFMPKGFRTILGPRSPEEVEEFGFIEDDSTAYPPRTRKNILASDATIQFAYDWSSRGERLTSSLVQQRGKPNYKITLLPIGSTGYGIDRLARPTLITYVATWIHDNEIEILNVAGNGNTKIEGEVESFLIAVFTNLSK